MHSSHKKRKKNRIRIGINGFGRIGRMVTRLIQQTENIRVTLINTNFTDVSQIAYLMKYDTCHGTYPGEIYTRDNKLYINDHEIQLELKVDLVENLGFEKIIYTKILDHQIIIKSSENVTGQSLKISFSKKKILFFDKNKNRIR